MRHQRGGALAPRYRIALAVLTFLGIIAALGVTFVSSPTSVQPDSSRILGAISTVSGDRFSVTTANGTTEVTVGDTTKISEAVPAQLRDVVVGSCLTVAPAAESDGVITARWVLISAALDGKCPPRQNSGAKAGRHGVRGVVTSVSGATVTLAGDTAPTTVAITAQTDLHKRTTAGTNAIAAGKCVAGSGSRGADGDLDATALTLWDSAAGDCPKGLLF